MIIAQHFGLQEWVKNRPDEDSFAYDEKAGMFVVADGVGLFQDIEYRGKYPKVSGSALLAKRFCFSVKKFSQSHLKGDLKKTFAFANKEAGKVNHGRSKHSTIPDARNLFAATAALARIRNSVVEFGHISDASVAAISKNGRIRWWKYTHRHRFPWPQDSGKYNVKTWTFFARTLVRNAIGQNGKLLGYGVVTGEQEAEKYFETGKYHLKNGDTIVLFTDGFEPYFQDKAFLKLLASISNKKDGSKSIRNFVAAKTNKLRSVLRGKRIDGTLPYEQLKSLIKRTLGERFGEAKWADEKTLIVIKL